MKIDRLDQSSGAWFFMLYDAIAEKQPIFQVKGLKSTESH